MSLSQTKNPEAVASGLVIGTREEPYTRRSGGPLVMTIGMRGTIFIDDSDKSVSAGMRESIAEFS